MKICINCPGEKDDSKFGKNRNICKKCQSKQRAISLKNKINKQIQECIDNNLPIELTCCSCRDKQNIENFIKNTIRCKECDKKQKAKYNIKPETKIKKVEYELKHNAIPEIKEKRKIYLKEYYTIPENKERQKEYIKEYNAKPEIKARKADLKKQKLKENPSFKLKEDVSSMIRKMIQSQGGYKGGISFKEKLGHDYPEKLVIHLEECFKKPGNEWMNFSNNGRYNSKTHNTNPTWNLDHIIPQSALKYDSLDHPNLLKCWALENLQPLDALENLKKSDKLPEDYIEKDICNLKEKGNDNQIDFNPEFLLSLLIK